MLRTMLFVFIILGLWLLLQPAPAYASDLPIPCGSC